MITLTWRVGVLVEWFAGQQVCYHPFWSIINRTYDVGDLQCSGESACNTSRRLVNTLTSKIEFSHIGALQDTNQDFFPNPLVKSVWNSSDFFFYHPSSLLVPTSPKWIFSSSAQTPLHEVIMTFWASSWRRRLSTDNIYGIDNNNSELFCFSLYFIIYKCRPEQWTMLPPIYLKWVLSASAAELHCYVAKKYA